MRDLIVLSLVAIGALWALRRPWIGVMLWTWISIMNPHRYTWGFAYDAPVAAIAAVATLLGLLFTKERQSPFQGAPVIWFSILAIWVTLSWAMGYDPVADYPQWDKVIKIYLMTFVALMLLFTKHHILAFVWVTVGSLALLGAKGGLFTILTGGNYRVYGPPASFIEDNNHLALALIMTIPLLYFLVGQSSKKWMRLILWVVIVLCAAAALGSHSRGGFLAITAMAAIWWWRSEKKLGVALVIGMALIFLLPMMPEHWWGRMATIQTYEQDPSAMGRINAWIVGWEVARHHFFGGGMSYQHQEFFTHYGVYEDVVRAAHSIYFQILGNHGFVGLAIYLGLWLSVYRTAGWLRKNAKNIAEAKWASDLGAMIQVSLIGYAVGGAFLSMPYFDLPYNMMVMAVLARSWVKKSSWMTEKDDSWHTILSLKSKKSNENSKSNGIGEVQRKCLAI